MDKRYFSDKIVKWYKGNQRPLPWRETTDPYRIWLSEVILQQTRVAQGLPYYLRITTAFPTVFDLAAASEQQVLRHWQGLGYYTRARNLHKCAQAVVDQYGGQFPSKSIQLEKLPGIGHYTAAAIASLAFGEKVAVLDGNVFRILSRIFGVSTPINAPEGKKKFLALANDLISDQDPATHNQAVMEFGALFCTPHNPQCDDCPFRRSCYAHAHSLVDTLPVKTPVRKARSRYFYYIVFEKNNALMMRKRSGKDIWQGLFDFMLVEKSRAVSPEKLLREPEYTAWFRNSKGIIVSGRYIHTLSHQTIHCRFIHVSVKGTFKAPEKGLAFYSRKEIAELPKPVLISRFLSEQPQP